MKALLDKEHVETILKDHRNMIRNPWVVAASIAFVVMAVFFHLANDIDDSFRIAAIWSVVVFGTLFFCIFFGVHRKLAKFLVCGWLARKELKKDRAFLLNFKIKL